MILGITSVCGSPTIGVHPSTCRDLDLIRLLPAANVHLRGNTGGTLALVVPGGATTNSCATATGFRKSNCALIMGIPIGVGPVALTGLTEISRV